VTQAADLREYQELVTESLKGSGVKQGIAAERLCQVFLPSELAEVVAQNDIGNLLEEVMSAARNVPEGGSDQELASLLATHVKGLAIDADVRVWSYKYPCITKGLVQLAGGGESVGRKSRYGSQR
jgi:hypothetical protein